LLWAKKNKIIFCCAGRGVDLGYKVRREQMNRVGQSNV
jgi:hypothetical protein